MCDVVQVHAESPVKDTSWHSAIEKVRRDAGIDAEAHLQLHPNTTSGSDSWHVM